MTAAPNQSLHLTRRLIIDSKSTRTCRRAGEQIVRRFIRAMGFTVYYQSVSSISSDLQTRLEEAAERHNETYAWAYCEPVGFFDQDDEGRLIGGSKPALGEPYESRRKHAAESNLRPGTLNTVIEILCDLSRTYGVDWEITHDFADDAVGFIRSGSTSPELTIAIKQIPAVDNDL